MTEQRRTNWQPRHQTALQTLVLRDVATYTDEPLCNRCANHYPTCADHKTDGTHYLHDETCATYTWANQMCNTCEKELSR